MMNVSRILHSFAMKSLAFALFGGVVVASIASILIVPTVAWFFLAGR